MKKLSLLWGIALTLLLSFSTVHAEDFWQDTLWIRKMPFGQNNFAKVMFHPDGKTIFATADNYMFEYDVQSGALLKTRLTKSGLSIADYELSADRQFMFIGTKKSGSTGNSALELWHLDTGFVKQTTIEKGAIRSLQLSPDNSIIYLGMEEPLALHRLNAQTMSIEKTKNSIGLLITLSPDGNTLISTFGYPDTKSVFLNAQDLTIQSYLPNYITAAKFTNTGEYIGGTYLSQGISYVVLYNTITKTMYKLPGHKGTLHDVCFTYDDKYLISAGYGDSDTPERGGYRIWDVTTKRLVYEAPYYTASSGYISLSPDNLLYAKVNGAFYVQMWKFSIKIADIEDNLKNSEFKITPNPTQSLIEVMLPSKFVSGKLSIIDMQGNNVITKIIDHTREQIGKISINISFLPNGSYTCKLESKSYISSSLFIINR